MWGPSAGPGNALPGFNARGLEPSRLVRRPATGTRDPPTGLVGSGLEAPFRMRRHPADTRDTLPGRLVCGGEAALRLLLISGHTIDPRVILPRTLLPFTRPTLFYHAPSCPLARQPCAIIIKILLF